MRKIVNYDVVEARTLVDLVKIVNAHIDYGWEPFEPIAFDAKHALCWQAMVKYEVLP